MISTVVLLAIVTLLTPADQVLGGRVRIVYLHGAWVWAGIVCFATAGISGLVSMIWQPRRWEDWSKVLGWTGLFFWWTYLPMSLVVMQVNWGGVYLDEPRFRIPLGFGVAGILLQAGLLLVNLPKLTSAANLAFGLSLVIALGFTRNVLHPDSPVTQSGSIAIQIGFVGLLILVFLLAAQIAVWLFQRFATSE